MSIYIISPNEARLRIPGKDMRIWADWPSDIECHRFQGIMFDIHEEAFGGYSTVHYRHLTPLEIERLCHLGYDVTRKATHIVVGW